MINNRKSQANKTLKIITILVVFILAFSLGALSFRFGRIVIHDPLISEYEHGLERIYGKSANLKVTVSRPTAYFKIYLTSTEHVNLDDLKRETIRFLVDQNIYESVLTEHFNGRTIWAKFIQIEIYLREGFSTTLLRQYKSGDLSWELDSIKSTDFKTWKLMFDYLRPNDIPPLEE